MFSDGLWNIARLAQSPWYDPKINRLTDHGNEPAGDDGLEIVHTDPDGGDYGGHFLIYGRGDDDSTWGLMELTGPK